MEDNGNGLADVTEGDGIYSAIFPYAQTVAGGYFTVQLFADDNDSGAMLPKDNGSYENGANCCGSRVNHAQKVPCPKFKRFATGGSFYVDYRVSSNNDIAPPARIIGKSIRNVN